MPAIMPLPAAPCATATVEIVTPVPPNFVKLAMVAGCGAEGSPSLMMIMCLTAASGTLWKGPISLQHQPA